LSSFFQESGLAEAVVGVTDQNICVDFLKIFFHCVEILYISLDPLRVYSNFIDGVYVKYIIGEI
jgi:hypothetical protein